MAMILMSCTLMIFIQEIFTLCQTTYGTCESNDDCCDDYLCDNRIFKTKLSCHSEDLIQFRGVPQKQQKQQRLRRRPLSYQQKKLQHPRRKRIKRKRQWARQHDPTEEIPSQDRRQHSPRRNQKKTKTPSKASRCLVCRVVPWV